MTENSEPISPTTSINQRILVGKRGWWNRITLGHSGDRLATALEIYYSEMRQFELDVIDAGLDPAHYGFQSIASLSEKSTDSLKRGDLELGWDAINAAQRIETQIYQGISQTDNPLKAFAEAKLHTRAINVLTEGNNKLSGWRKATLNSLLTDNEGQIKTDLDGLIQAQQILSDHFSNVYRRLKIISSQIRFLEMVAIIAIVLWVLLLVFRPGDEVMQPDPYSVFNTLASLIFGVLGACISGILRLENKSANQKIPEQMESYVYTIARPIVGAVSALALVMFVLAGILDIGTQTPGLYLAAAFAAGFSERLLKLGVGQLPDQDRDQPKATSSKN